MLRCHDDSRVDLGLWNPWQDAREIDDEFRGRMSNDGEVGIDSFRFLLAKFDIDLLRLIRVVHTISF